MYTTTAAKVSAAKRQSNSRQMKAVTSSSSSRVGRMLNTASRSTASTPLVPRSTARDRPPVCRSRWKRSDRRCRWRKVFSATMRTVRCCTLANTASRSSANPAEAMRSRPYAADQVDRHRQHRVALGRQGIDGVAVDQRHIDGGDLGRDQEDRPPAPRGHARRGRPSATDMAAAWRWSPRPNVRGRGCGGLRSARSGRPGAPRGRASDRLSDMPRMWHVGRPRAKPGPIGGAAGSCARGRRFAPWRAARPG